MEFDWGSSDLGLLLMEFDPFSIEFDPFSIEFDPFSIEFDPFSAVFGSFSSICVPSSIEFDASFHRNIAP